MATEKHILFHVPELKEYADHISEGANSALISDEISINHDDAEALKKIWRSANCGKRSFSEDDVIYFSMPTDILWSNTVPIKNLRIIDDERGSLVDRKLIFEVFTQDVPDHFLHESQHAYFPVCILREDDVIFPLFLDNTRKNSLMADHVIMQGDCFRLANQYEEDFQDIAINILNRLTIWYGLQIALLHPQIKEVFNTSTKRQRNDKEKDSTSSKRKTKYVRRIIKNGKIAKAINHHITRKTLCWYVCGHWREYKNGKRIFITGYWKGPLREAKRNLDEGRESILDYGNI